MSRGNPRGFTLVELLAALTICGLALAGATALLDQLGDGSARIARESLRASREGNGARLLARLLMDASASTDSTQRFRGDGNSLELSTLCDAPGGWREPCRVTLSIDRRGDSSVVLAGLPGNAAPAVLRRAGTASFRYFRPMAGTDTMWVMQWSSNASLPVAMSVVARDDTIILPVGPARD
jgi:prepilin-type N-terminal cleavage/methylation domain-containing protein